MVGLVLGHDGTVAEWAGKKLGAPCHPPLTAWGIVDKDGTLTGAIIFNSFVRGGNIDLTIVGRSAIRKGIFRQIANYVFGQLGCTRLSARTRRGNVVVRKGLPRAGFKFEGVQERYFGATRGDDGLLFGLRREAATRWME